MEISLLLDISQLPPLKVLVLCAAEGFACNLRLCKQEAFMVRRHVYDGTQYFGGKKSSGESQSTWLKKIVLYAGH